MQELLDYVQTIGYQLASILPDGQIHRFKIDSTDHTHSGFYVAFQNHSQNTGETFYIVRIGSWRDGIENAHTHSTLKSKMTTYDRQLVKKQMEEAKKKSEKEREYHQKEVAIEVRKIWELLQENGGPTYLDRKKVGAYGIRFKESDIYIPLRDASGILWSIQKIDPQGNKYFFPGARVKGCFHTIGEETETIYLCEGYSTGATIHAATQKQVVVSFNSGNLVEVAKEFKDKKVIICGDEDQFKERNAGRIKAEEVARRYGFGLIFPRFKLLDGKPTDFNDLQVREGIEEVATQLMSTDVAEIEFDSASVIEMEFPDENPKTNKRAGTIENVREVLRRLKINARYNVISKRAHITIPGANYSIDNDANASLAQVNSWCERCRVPTTKLKSYLLEICDRNQYNPVASWIESVEWDGESRLQEFYDTIVSTNEELKEKLIRKWLISAVAAAYESDGVSAHGVLVLRGKQYLGKTAWFKRLAPSDLKLLADGMFLRPDDKDSAFQALSHWIVELGELDATFKKADISQLKAFLTKNRDILRRPYAELESEFPRRTVFFGSVNENDFLKDPTGNRRFWSIDCTEIKYNHNVDMQQLWAEVLTIYRSGEKWILPVSEIEELNTHNQQFEVVEPVDERIRHGFLWNVSQPVTWMSASQICISLGIENPHQRDTRAASVTLRKIGVETRTRDGYTQFHMPAPVAKVTYSAH